MTAIPVSIATPSAEAGLCFTVRRNDHVVVSRLIAEKRLGVHGLILDARNHERQETLRQQAQREGMGTWLDTQAMELALPSGITEGHRLLPWGAMPASAEEWTSTRTSTMAQQIARFATDGGYSKVLAPTHFIPDLSSDWLDVDAALTCKLRNALDSQGAHSVELVYPLAMPTRAIGDVNVRNQIVRHLRSLPTVGVSLRIHPFGNGSGPLVMRNLIDAFSHLRDCGQPLVIERAGFAGLLMFSMGAVSQVESGIALGDSFNVGARLRSGGMTGSAPMKERIYLSALGMSLDLDIAQTLMRSNRGFTRFACQSRDCCPNGITDMVRDPRRHSILARQTEFATLWRLPASERARHFLLHFLTPACDMLSRAGRVVPRFKEVHRRELSVKETLAALIHDRSIHRTRPPVGVEPGPGAQVITFPSRDTKGR